MDMLRAKRAITTQNGATARQVALVRRASDLIDALEGERLTLSEIAKQLDVSPWHLQRLFKRVMGVSPRDYADARRNAAFRAQLKSGESIAQATYGAGYGSSSRVYERAERLLGMTPASYAKGGKGAVIVYDIVDSPLERLLVAATAKGLCFLSLGNDDAELVAELKREFPQAESIARDQHSIAQSVSVVVDFLKGLIPHAELPLDVRATAFQRRVWQELIAIPCGETRSYSEIAESLGLPRGQRAVGRACATNPVSLVIPCHRALREDGGLGGYRWGVARKAALLETEADHPE
jgi:AraC family transcriptional regulator of adaptative response/methylated-DNA-[protein]-cysteine methyltransferase